LAQDALFWAVSEDQFAVATRDKITIANGETRAEYSPPAPLCPHDLLLALPDEKWLLSHEGNLWELQRGEIAPRESLSAQPLRDWLCVGQTVIGVTERNEIIRKI
jgi:hypothetical protein